MKVSVEWLKDYSEINVSTKELSDIMTMSGSKVEAIETKGDNIKNVVVGKILEIKQHPDADKLVVCKVNVGTEIIQIVTGANNIAENDIVPIAKDGSELPNDVKIKKGMLRNIESNGMMCSIGELDLSLEQYPDQIEEGIMILPKSMESEIGKDIVDVLNLREDIIEFEITPNRPDCLSVEGLGREVAASLNEEFKNPHKNLVGNDIAEVNSIEGLNVSITAPELCYRYVARVVKNVQIAESPDWLKRRLIAAGVRPINNIVDITNYVMLEFGQPMHAFDINSISGKKIVVRKANNDEKIITLDGTERILDENNLVIADAEKPVAVAGVMGGENSGIEENTNTVVFESAVFNAGGVRKTASKLGLRTEASARYEKGLPQENCLRAANRAVQLVELLGAGEPVKEVIDIYPTKQEINKIEFNPEKVNALLGTDISKEDMIRTLEKLEIKLQGNELILPSYRQDIEGTPDIAEEVLRFYGYNNLGSTLIDAESTLGIKNKSQRAEDDVKNLLINKGLSEIYTYGFINEKDLNSVRINEYNTAIKIKNPLSEDYTMMRTTTVPSVMRVLSQNNAKKNKDVKVFDFGRIYINNGEIEKGELPYEPNMITIGMYGKDCDFYVLKGLVENVLETMNVKKYDIFKEENASEYHPGRCAKLFVGKDEIVKFGEIHPVVLDNYDMSGKAYVAEIYFDKLVRYGKDNKKYTEIPKFPAVERDIAIVVDEDVEVGQIEKIITKKANKLLEKLELFDVYRDEKLGKNKKSIAYSLTFRVNDRTLTDEEISGIINGIISDLKIELNAELRG